MNENCKYRLPCGWCDRQNKRCEMKKTSTLGTVTEIDTLEEHYATAISSKKKSCGSCDCTDGMAYTSIPPQVRCKITGRFHYMDDVCDCDTIAAQMAGTKES